MKNKNQKPSSSEETVQAKVRGGSSGGRSETKRGRICERGRFKAGSEREMELDVQSGESEEEEVMGEGIGEQEMEELMPE